MSIARQESEVWNLLNRSILPYERTQRDSVWDQIVPQRNVGSTLPLTGELKFLGADGKPTTELKVAKMEDSLNKDDKGNYILDPEKDKDRFYVQLTDSSLKGKGTVTVKLSTDNENNAYDDDATEIELTESPKGSGIFKSQAQILTGDEVDDNLKVNGIEDDQKNDQTHKVALGSQVKVGYNGGELTAEAKVPIKKTVEIDLIILRDKPENEGGKPVIDKKEVEKDFAIAQERYAQLGIELKMKGGEPRIVDPPEGLSVKGDENDLARIMTDLGTSDPNDLEVFYVNNLNPGGLNTANGVSGGVSINKRFIEKGIAEDPNLSGSVRYINNSFINVNFKKEFTLAHELGHLLTDNNHFGEDYATDVSQDKITRNLMKDETSETNSIGASKRFTTDQQNAVYQNLGVKP
ncbi:MAG: hypothetical protein R3F23_04815 [Verrucomicrobiia bacterium]